MSDTPGVPFRFLKTDFDLCDGTKRDSMLLRDRLLSLYRELLPRLESDPILRSFVKISKPRNGLRSKSPYVPYYQRHGGGYKGASWIGFADPVRYLDPRVGIQFQYGVAKDEYWYGIWVQGDQPTRKTERELCEVLDRSSFGQIAASMNALGSAYWVQVRRDREDEAFIDTSADRFTSAQAKQFVLGLKGERMWISVDKNLTDDELVAIEDVPSDILRTTHELLELYRWLAGVAPRGLTEDEALAQLKRGETIKISEDETIPTSEREGIANSRVGQSALRRLVLDNYGHRCAVCDISSDALLWASHISPWAEDEENRGNPRNVICLCIPHDKLFERGLLRVHPDYAIEFDSRADELGRRSQMFSAIRENTLKTLRLPSGPLPDPSLLRRKLSAASVP
jgi:hypothetical protein